MAEYIERWIAIARLTALEIMEPCVTMTDAKRLLADMPAVSVPQWISVKDRLPEDDNLRVLVASVELEHVTIARYLKRSNVWKTPSGFSESFTHWMPLPEPPKGENDG